MKKLSRRIKIKALEIKGLARYAGHQIKPQKPHQKTRLPDPAGKTTIAELQRDECIGCGLCYAVCPTKAITMTSDEWGYIPQLNTSKCTNCGLCVKQCPGVNIIPFTPPLGHIEEIYTGHAVNKQVRHTASSGGVTRTLLTAALENGLVDRIIYTRATADPLNPETVIASTLDVDDDSLNSLYSPTNPLSVLRDLDKSLKYAFVGLPCHIAGIALSPRLRKLIPLTIGIFCSHTPGFPFVKRFQKDFGGDEELKGLRYRGLGWPGKSSLLYSDGDRVSLHFAAVWDIYNYTKSLGQPRCSLCPYYSAEQADLSVGDPWGYVHGDPLGSTLILVRTPEGKKALEAAESLIETKLVPPEDHQQCLRFHINSAATKTPLT